MSYTTSKDITDHKGRVVDVEITNHLRPLNLFTFEKLMQLHKTDLGDVLGHQHANRPLLNAPKGIHERDKPVAEVVNEVKRKRTPKTQPSKE